MTRGIWPFEKCAARLKVPNPSDFGSQVAVLSSTEANAFTDENLMANLYPEAIAREISHKDVGGRPVRHDQNCREADVDTGWPWLTT
jgi:hypothetical protein